MAGTASTLDRRSVAPVSDAEIDAFARRIAEILLTTATPEAFDEMVEKLGELCELAEKHEP